MEAFRDAVQARCDSLGLLGTILVASEGINGTVAGKGSAISAMLEWIEQMLALDTKICARWTEAEAAPFRRMRVRHKKEIVTLGRPDILPHGPGSG